MSAKEREQENKRRKRAKERKRRRKKNEKEEKKKVSLSPLFFSSPHQHHLYRPDGHVRGLERDPLDRRVDEVAVCPPQHVVDEEPVSAAGGPASLAAVARGELLEPGAVGGDGERGGGISGGVVFGSRGEAWGAPVASSRACVLRPCC